MLKAYISAKTQLEDLKDRFRQDQDGASLIEYSVLIGLITVAAISLILAVSGWVAAQWTALNGAL